MTMSCCLILTALLIASIDSLNPAMSLMEAAETGAFTEFEAAIAAGEDVNQVDIEGRTALHMAAEMGYVAHARLVLDSGGQVDPESRTEQVLVGYGGGARGGTTPLLDAAAEGHHQVLSLLLGRGADPGRRDAQGENALTKSIKAGCLECVGALGQITELQQDLVKIIWLTATRQANLKIIQAILETEFMPCLQDEATGDGALHLVAGEGWKNTWTAVFTAYREANCSLNQINRRSETPLMLAAKQGHAGIVGQLLEAAVDTEVRGGLTNQTAVELACVKGNSHVLQAFLDHSEPSIVELRQLLALSVKYGHSTAAELLMERGVGAADQEPGGEGSILELGIKADKVDMVALLLASLEHNRDSQHDGAMSRAIVQDALLAAAIGGNPVMVSTLVVSGGAEVDGAMDRDGMTALMHAARRGMTQACSALIDLGASITATNQLGQNASVIANNYEQKDPRLVKLLQPDNWQPTDPIPAPPQHVRRLTSLDGLLAEPREAPLLVLFTKNENCAGCPEADTAVVRAAAELGALAEFGILDLTVNPGLQLSWKVTELPAILVFEVQGVATSYTGDMSAEALVDHVLGLINGKHRPTRSKHTVVTTASSTGRLDGEL